MIRVVAGGPGSRRSLQRIYRPIREVGVSQTGRRLPRALDLQEIRAQLPREQWPTTRTYTIRWIDAVAAELAIDFVYHGEVASPDHGRPRRSGR